jgi:hypothetical protein
VAASPSSPSRRPSTRRGSAEPASRRHKRRTPPTSSLRPHRPEPSRWPSGEQARSGRPSAHAQSRHPTTDLDGGMGGLDLAVFSAVRSPYKGPIREQARRRRDQSFCALHRGLRCEGGREIALSRVARSRSRWRHPRRPQTARRFSCHSRGRLRSRPAWPR